MSDRLFSSFAPAGVLLLATLSTISSAATYQVSSIAELTSTISTAVPGDIIIVLNGVYTTSSSIAVNRVGTAAGPILIRAETVGGVEITGTHGFSLKSPAAYVTIQGFKFTHAAAIGISSGTSHCRFARNVVELAIPAGSDVSYLNISGDDVEIDRNELRNKSTLGNMLDVTGSGSQVARRLWVHHNYFHDFTRPGGNGAETIRLGLSGLSLSTGKATVEYNLFVRCNGENEMISNKSSGNTYRYNTVLDCPRGEISQRHGNDCLYYGNYMRNTQGMRIYGDRHKIFSNYLESNSIGVNMGNGDGDVYHGDPLTSHDRPDDNVVVYNTFINNSKHYEMGRRTGGLGSSNTVVANNIFQGGGVMASISTTAPYTGTWSNNIRWQTSSAGNMPSSGYMTANPLLVTDPSGVYHLQAGSPAIDAGAGSHDYYGKYSSYPHVTTDMDAQPRDTKKDIGADEFSAAPVLAHILTTNDVGPNSSSVTGGMAIYGTEMFYTDLEWYGPSDAIHVAPYGIEGSGGADIRTLPNPRVPATGIQDLAFHDGVLYALTGYLNDALEVFELDRNTGVVVGGPISIGSPANSDADGFTVLPNGNFLINDGDAEPVYREYDGTSGTFVSGGLVLDLRAFGFPHGTGVATSPDGQSLFFIASFSLDLAPHTLLQTDLAGNLIRFQDIGSTLIEDIAAVIP